MPNAKIKKIRDEVEALEKEKPANVKRLKALAKEIEKQMWRDEYTGRELLSLIHIYRRIQRVLDREDA